MNRIIILILIVFLFVSCEKNEEDQLTSLGFELTSSEIGDDQLLPTEYTCDGKSSTLPLNWSGVPEGTTCFALVMHHEVSDDDIHWYWIVYNISGDITSIDKNETGFGRLGTNSVNGLTEYSSPCSQGPGEKAYTYTLYALSEYLEISIPEEVSLEILLNEMDGLIIVSCELYVYYSREF